MDTTKMKMALYGLLACMGLLLGACNSSTDGGGAPVTKEQLVGKWNFTSFRYNLSTSVKPADPEYPNSTVDTTMNLTGSGKYQTFNADGTYQAVFPDFTSLLFGKRSAEGDIVETGTWSVSGSVLTTVSADEFSNSVAVVLDGASGTFTENLDDSYTEGPSTYTSKGAITIKATKE